MATVFYLVKKCSKRGRNLTTQNQYPASKVILIHGKIATCDTKTMEDAFIVKGSGAPNDRMFPNTLEVTRVVLSTL